MIDLETAYIVVSIMLFVTWRQIIAYVAIVSMPNVSWFFVLWLAGASFVAVQLYWLGPSDGLGQFGPLALPSPQLQWAAAFVALSIGATIRLLILGRRRLSYADRSSIGLNCFVILGALLPEIWLARFIAGILGFEVN